MGYISESNEVSIQVQLPASTSVAIDGAMLYINAQFFRYIEGGQHITGDCSCHVAGEPWYWLPRIARELFTRKVYILNLETPICWDNDGQPIPKGRLAEILSRMDRALRKKHLKYKIEFYGATEV